MSRFWLMVGLVMATLGFIAHQPYLLAIGSLITVSCHLFRIEERL